MVKDKLVKYNHKAPFYRLRKCAIFTACFFGCAASVAVPVSLHIVNENTAALKAEVEENSEVEEMTNETSEELLSAY